MIVMTMLKRSQFAFAIYAVDEVSEWEKMVDEKVTERKGSWLIKAAKFSERQLRLNLK